MKSELSVLSINLFESIFLLKLAEAVRYYDDFLL